MGRRIDPLELVALARIVDELDYYQLLGVNAEAPGSQIKTAYHECARRLHPDSNRQLDSENLAHCQRVARRISEAYSVLRDPRRRRAYDAHISTNGGPRLQLADCRAAEELREDSERSARTPQGRQFWQRANVDMACHHWTAAIRNLQTALAFEPGSEFLLDMLHRARACQKEDSQASG